MRSLLKIFLGVLFAGVICLAQEGATTVIPQESVSAKRIELLQELLNNQKALQGAAATEESLTEAVLEKFIASDAALRKVTKDLLLEDATMEQVEKKLLEDAQKEFPEYSQEELIRQSEKEYPLYKKWQRVKVTIHTNPKKTEKKEGIYQGMKGPYICIGPNTYLLKDMEGIEGNEGPHGEIAKFDESLNSKYRMEWREEYTRTNSKNRRKFLDSNRAKYEETQRKEDFLENEKRGYTYYQEQERWVTPEELVAIFASRIALDIQTEIDAQAQQAMDTRIGFVDAQVTMSKLSAAAVHRGELPSAEKEIIARAEAERKRQENLENKKKQKEALDAQAEENLNREEEERARKREELLKNHGNQEAPAKEEGISYTTYAVGAVVAVLVLLGAGWWWNKSRKEDQLDVASFYEGKGKLQKEFWDAANADPDNFRYVAYLFPDMDAAKNALLRLSYISTDENGNIISKKADLRYGCYEHQNGAVAFVGSPTLNYARWREASMIWPDIPLSNYFKVSSEPAVSLVLPDLHKGVKVEDLGVEDIITDSGEVNRVYRFRAASKEEAIKFLGEFEIKEEGLVVRVESPAGEFGKDINGVFEA